MRKKEKNKAGDGELSKVGKQEKFQEIEEDVHLEAAAVHPGYNGKMSCSSCESTENA